MAEPRGYHNAVSDPVKAAAVEQMRAQEEASRARGATVLPLRDPSVIDHSFEFAGADLAPTGRPPTPWKISGQDVVDRLDDGERLDEVAKAAGVAPRTVVRVLRRCGYVRSREARNERYLRWLPSQRVHRIDDLAQLRRALRREGWDGGARTFAELTGIPVSIMTEDTIEPTLRHRAVWLVLDSVDIDVSRGVDWSRTVSPLPGEPGSRWAVRAERTENTWTRRRPLPRRNPGGRPRESKLDDNKVAILYAYAQGESLQILADRYSVALSTLYRRMREWGQGEEMKARRRRSPNGPGGAQTGTILVFGDEDDDR